MPHFVVDRTDVVGVGYSPTPTALFLTFTPLGRTIVVTPRQKLQVNFVRPGSPEWFAMWRVVRAGELTDYGLDLKAKPCPLCTSRGCWGYRGSLHRSHQSVTDEWRLRTPDEIQFAHVFRHNEHPILHAPMIRIVPCTKGWEPEGPRA